MPHVFRVVLLCQIPILKTYTNSMQFNALHFERSIIYTCIGIPLCTLHIVSFSYLNPKRSGLFFCLSQVRGTQGSMPPPISAAERRNILKFWIMQIYVNYMHVFLFPIIYTIKRRRACCESVCVLCVCVCVCVCVSVRPLGHFRFERNFP